MQEPQGHEAVLGADGGVLQAADGAILAIGPGSLDTTRDVSFTTVAESALPMAIPAEWTYLAGYDIQFAGDKLASPGAAGDSGARVDRRRHASLPRALRPAPGREREPAAVWWQDEVAIVGDDHIARTSSPPWPGVSPAGVYSLLAPPPGYSLVRGIFTANFPIGIFPVAATLLGVMATFSPFIAVSINVSSVRYVALPPDSLPITSDVNVHLSAGAVTNVSVTLARSPAMTPQAPTILAERFEFQTIGGTVTPVAIIDGIRFTQPAASLSSQLTAVWHQQGQEFLGAQVGSVVTLSNGLSEITVKIPQQVVSGLAEVSLVRTDTIPALDPHTLHPIQVQRNYESNRLQLAANQNYVVTGSYGCIANCAPGSAQPAVFSAEVDVFTQGNPFAADPASQLQLVAQVPVGQPWGANGSTTVRSTALTTDLTRAYATLTSQTPTGPVGSVGVVDMLALQQVDAIPGNCSATCPDAVDQIALPAGALPFWIVADKLGKYAYVSDQRDYGTPSSGIGRIYVIDIDPKSPTFNQRIRTIDVESAGVGLRQIAVADDGKRLYAAAPNRDGSAPVPSGGSSTSYLLVVNIDEAEVPQSPPANPHHYDEQIAKFATGIPGEGGQEAYAVQTTGDPSRVLLTNRYVDVHGVQELDITNDSSASFVASIKDVADLTLGATSDTFDVNNGEALLVLPANVFSGVIGPDGTAIGPHPEYIFVAAYNRFIQDDPSHDPNAVTNSLSGAPVPGGSNVGIIRGGALVAGTTPIPIGSIDNLAFASGFNYMYASYRGVEVGSGMGAVFVYNLVNLVWEVEKDLHDAVRPEPAAAVPARACLLRPVDERHRHPAADREPAGNQHRDRHQGRLPRHSLRRERGADADRPAVRPGPRRALPRRGRRRALDYNRNQYGGFIHPDGSPVLASEPAAAVRRRTRPFGVGGLARGLSADVTKTGPGPLIWNAAMAGLKWGVDQRWDSGVERRDQRALQAARLPADKAASDVQLYSGARDRDARPRLIPVARPDAAAAPGLQLDVCRRHADRHLRLERHRRTRCTSTCCMRHPAA